MWKMASSVKHARKSLALKEKLQIVDDLERKKKTQASICRELGLPKSTVATIWSDRDKIKAAAESGSSSWNRKKLRPAKYEDIDEAVYRWFCQAREKNVPISAAILKAKAVKYALSFGVNDFACSNGWIDHFKQRHDLSFKTIIGEKGDVNMDTTQTWLKDVFPTLIEGYKSNDIYNADETGLFYQLLPNKTLARAGDECAGNKRSKQRITLLLGANMDGTDCLTPLVIGKSANPRCFKNVKTLPVTYRNNNKAWMTGYLWTEWIRSLDNKMASRKRKIVLFVDNCPAHPVVSNLKAIVVHYLPPNTTAVLQPMDQGIIQCFKSWYRKLLLERMVDCIDNEIAFEVNVLQAMNFTKKAWEHVTEECVANCFRHAGWTEGALQELTLPTVSNECERLGIEERIITELDAEEWEVATCEELEDDEIVQCVLSSKKTVEEEHEEEKEDMAEPIIPTFEEFLTAIETVRAFTQSLPESEDLLGMINKIEADCREKKVSNLQQSSLDMYFK